MLVFGSMRYEKSISRESIKMRPTWGNHYLLSAKINSLVFILQSEATFSGAPCQDELGIWNKMSMYQNRNTLTNTEKYWAPFFFATTVMRWTALNKEGFKTFVFDFSAPTCRMDIV